MSEQEIYPNQFQILPKGKYTLVFDNKILGVFDSNEAAIKAQSTLGRRGSRIVPPNLRAQMSEGEIKKAESVLDKTEKKPNYGPHRGP